MNIIGEITFWCIAAMTVISAVIVVFHHKIIYSAFALLFTFFGMAGLYVYLGADFLAASQALVYVGGILTLIIFGVFMTARISSLSIPQQTHQRYLALIPMILIFIGLYRMIIGSGWQDKTLEIVPTTEIIGRLLLTQYLIPFEMASILLLAALIGAMRLARHFRQEV